MNMADIATIADGLSDLERKLLLNEEQGWGSWMAAVGADLVAKGLGSRPAPGRIAFDTPLAQQVISELNARRRAA